jgi:hypothetical protein
MGGFGGLGEVGKALGLIRGENRQRIGGRHDDSSSGKGRPGRKGEKRQKPLTAKGAQKSRKGRTEKR